MLAAAKESRTGRGRDSDSDAIALLLPGVLKNIELAFEKKGALKAERSSARFLECLQSVANYYPAAVSGSLMMKVRVVIPCALTVSSKCL